MKFSMKTMSMLFTELSRNIEINLLEITNYRYLDGIRNILFPILEKRSQKEASLYRNESSNVAYKKKKMRLCLFLNKIFTCPDLEIEINAILALNGETSQALIKSLIFNRFLKRGANYMDYSESRILLRKFAKESDRVGVIKGSILIKKLL